MILFKIPGLKSQIATLEKKSVAIVKKIYSIDLELNVLPAL